MEYTATLTISTRSSDLAQYLLDTQYLLDGKTFKHFKKGGQNQFFARKEQTTLWAWNNAANR